MTFLGTLCLVALLGCFKGHLASGALVASDLEAWQAIFDELGGGSWKGCNGKRDSPCSCSKGSPEAGFQLTVACATNGDQDFIKTLKLVNAGLSGTLRSSVLDLFSDLEKLDLSNNDDLQADGPWVDPGNGKPCIDIAKCYTPDWSCGAPLCEEQTDLGVWIELFDSTNGDSWKHCSQHRKTPCECDEGTGEERRFVECSKTEDEERYKGITSITLPNNDMDGVLPVSDLEKLSSLTELRLANTLNGNANSFPTSTYPSKCLEILKCTGDWTCTFPESTKLCELSDLALWRKFYDALHDDTGIGSPVVWEVCEGNRDTPCSCQGPSRLKYVECTEDKQNIRVISLQLNNMRGNFPFEILKQMKFLRGVYIDNQGQTAIFMNKITTSDGKNCLNEDIQDWCDVLATKCINGDCGCKIDLPECTLPPTPFPTTAPPTTGFPTPAPTPVPVDQGDLAIWMQIYDAFDGDNWFRCQGLREDPCTCDAEYSRVVCENERITKIILQNNNLQGALPSDDIIAGLDKLVNFNIGNNIQGYGIANNIGYAGGSFCLRWESCITETIKCILPEGLEYCLETPAPSPPTMAPTLAPVNEDDLHAWKSLYDSTGGASWALCAEDRDSPCECNTTNKYVTCVFDEEAGESKITELILPQNNMNGVLPVSQLSKMASLTKLDLRRKRQNTISDSNFNQFTYGPGEDCVELYACVHAGNWECDITGTGVDFCDPTEVPTESPTLFPTTAPTVFEPSYMCHTEGGYDPGKPCASTFTIDGVGPYTETCISMSQHMPFFASQVDPEFPTTISADKWCPTVEKYSSTEPDDRRSWTYCNCYFTTSAPTTFSPTRHPTTLGDALEPGNMAVWRTIYDKNNGEAWINCQELRGNPCACTEMVVCKRIDESVYIQSLDLRGNNVKGSLKTTIFAMMPNLITVKIDPNLIENICLDMPHCDDNPSCTIQGTRLCSDDSVPTPKPTTINAPTPEPQSKSWRIVLRFVNAVFDVEIHETPRFRTTFRALFAKVIGLTENSVNKVIILSVEPGSVVVVIGVYRYDGPRDLSDTNDIVNELRRLFATEANEAATLELGDVSQTNSVTVTSAEDDTIPPPESDDGSSVVIIIVSVLIVALFALAIAIFVARKRNTSNRGSNAKSESRFTRRRSSARLEDDSGTSPVKMSNPEISEAVFVRMDNNPAVVSKV